MAFGEKTCPQCAEQVKAAARICKHCGHNFVAANEQPAPSGSGVGRKIGAGCLIVFAVFVFLVILGEQVGKNAGTATPSTATSASADASPAPSGDAAPADAAPASNWTYFDNKDEVRNKTDHFAAVTSDNSVEFDFPYGGGSTLTMTVRKSAAHGEDVYFRISSGQFVCGIEECRGAISFDGKSESLSLSEPDDNSSDVLFATYGAGIIGKLKAAKRTVVELPFYQEGDRQFVFQTKGLIWPPKGK